MAFSFVLNRYRPLEVWLISDVAGDEPAIIGSGPLFPGRPGPREPLDCPDWLRRLVADLSLDNAILKEVSQGNF